MIRSSLSRMDFTGIIYYNLLIFIMKLNMAERERFELSVPVIVHTLSRRAPSAARSSLRSFFLLNCFEIYFLFMAVNGLLKYIKNCNRLNTFFYGYIKFFAK